MTDTRWRLRFEGLLEELEAHPSIRVDQVKLGPPASGADVAAAEASLGRALPDELRTFYAQMDGVHIEWQHVDPRWAAFGASGSVRIFPLSSLRHRDEQAWWAIDFPHDTDYLGCAKHSNKLFWVDEEAEGRGFGVSFDGYLDALLETRGWSHWQRMFLYSRRYQSTVQESEGRMQALLPALFGTFDSARVGNAAKCAPADVTFLLEGPRIFTYRLADLPPALTADIPTGHALWSMAFFLTERDSPIVSELFEAVPEPKVPDIGAGMTIAGLMGRAVSQTFCTPEIVAPHQVPVGGRSTLIMKSSLHSGDAQEVEMWFRGRGCDVLPIQRWLEYVSFVEVTSADGTRLDAVRQRSHVINVTSRGDLPAVGDGLFIVDRTDRANERLTLFHHPIGLRYASRNAGPGEHWLEVSLGDLRVDDVTELRLLAEKA